MVVIIKNGKITAIDKKLLNIFNADMSTLNEIISPLEMNIASIKTGNISILSKEFKILEIPVLSVDDIKIFDLTPLASDSLSEEILPPADMHSETSPSLEDELLKNYTPKTEENENLLSSVSIDDEFNVASKNNEKFSDLNSLLNKTEENKYSDAFNLEKDLFPAKENNAFTEPVLTDKDIVASKEEEEITISFNDEFDEINNILAMNKENAKKLLEHDLQKASKDLGIDIPTLYNLLNNLFKQIEENRQVFTTALEQKDYDIIHETAHSLKGAALNLRLSNIALILKTIDEESKKASSIAKLEFLINQFYTFIDKIKDNENEHSQNKITQDNKEHIKISEPIKNMILQTIKNYLSTQNEKKFKKDLKYIEKLLNTKIGSIEELENLCKADK